MNASNSQPRIVIIGNGVAGMEAALTVREREPDSPLTIISEESDHFFSRTALMWVFSGQMSHRDIEPLERDAYARLNIQRVRARATGIDLAGRTVQLAGGQSPVPYDRLLIACGSRPRPGPWPGSDLRGVGHFVTLQDLAWFEREVHGQTNGEPARADAHVVATEASSPYRPREVAAEKRGTLSRAPAVVGGGLIGIEAIEVLVARGLLPHFFIREEWFWPIAVEPREARWITDRMSEHGVQVHLEHELEKLDGDAAGNLTAIHTNHGKFDVDCAVVAIGVVPNTDWLESSGLELARGGAIVVDESLRTSDPHVFAAGDCAAVRWFDGSQRPEQLWYTSRDQGRVAGRSMLGDRVGYQRGLWYNSAKLMDVEYTTVGLVNMQVEDERNWFFEERGKVRSTTRVVLSGERVVGFNMLGRRWDHEILGRWIEQRRSLPWVLERLNEASFDTEFVPPLKIDQSARKRALEGPAPSPVKGPHRFPEAW